MYIYSLFSFLSGYEIKREIGEELKEEGPDKKRPMGNDVEMKKERIRDDSEGVRNGSINEIVMKKLKIHDVDD